MFSFVEVKSKILLIGDAEIGQKRACSNWLDLYLFIH